MIIVVVVVIVGIGIYWLVQRGSEKYTGPVEKVRVAAGKSAVLVYIAKEQEFFQKNGLDVEIKDYQAGKLATDALLAGDADLSTAAQSVLANHGFERDDLRALVAIAAYQIKELVARKDRGIFKISDLKGKKVGVTKKSAGEFALGKFLIFNELSLKDVELVNLKPLEIVEAVINGEIDAALTWDPYVYNIKQILGDVVVSWPGDSGEDTTFLLLTKEEWLRAHPLTAERFLTALLEAEKYVKENSDKTQQFLKQRFDYEALYLQLVWPKYKFTVSLPQTLIVTMEGEARWRIKNNLTDAKEVPNYLNYIYLDALESVKPEAVTIIR